MRREEGVRREEMGRRIQGSQDKLKGGRKERKQEGREERRAVRVLSSGRKRIGREEWTS